MTMHKVAVPAQVMNGTMPYVILDCDYTLDASEMRSGGTMVLKWYWNGRNIYQWIPPAHPRVCHYIYTHIRSASVLVRCEVTKQILTYNFRDWARCGAS